MERKSLKTVTVPGPDVEWEVWWNETFVESVRYVEPGARKSDGFKFPLDELDREFYEALPKPVQEAIDQCWEENRPLEDNEARDPGGRILTFSDENGGPVMRYQNGERPIFHENDFSHRDWKQAWKGTRDRLCAWHKREIEKG